MNIETKCVQCGYAPKNGEPRVVPVSMSTTFKYDSTETVGRLFDLKEDGFFYTRLANPTTDAVEKKLAALEGGTAAMLTSSGQAATTLAVLNLVSGGEKFVSSSEIYGGTYNLFAVTLKRLGIECIFVRPDDTAALEAALKDGAKAVFAETVANPALGVIDIEKWANIAHKAKVPLIIDNTFATPVLCRPFEFGADIVVHSTSKYLDGHAVSLGGAIVDGGRFDYKEGGYKQFTEPDESYHGVVYADAFKDAPFVTKARVQLMRDLGSMISPMNAFLLNIGMETLHLRMPRHSANALAAAKFLKQSKKVVSVCYPALESDTQYEKCRKYLGGMGSGVVNFDLGSRENAVKFMDALSLAKICVHVADARTCVLHPASSTHRQLGDTELCAAGINPGTIRLSCGIENSEDILADLSAALKSV
ncbi:MAG: aminotransferase class I/II-fold pyridoxal phosphate-dependent enzyme [Clostridia bacterium]|nr:aminotransferase class I/II-fold pyridoxal phosphate-dependent enzyme [Clostridia bacterium]